MSTSDVCIATLTWARGEEEEALLKDALQQLAGLDIPVYITDGGSTDTFLKFLESIPLFHLVPAKGSGVWAQAGSSLIAARDAGYPFVVYTEPDKKDFFRDGLLKMISHFEPGSRGGVLLASRTPEGFGSYPTFQQMTETTINNCCSEVIGKTADYTYGPFLFRSKLINYLQQVQEDLGWGWRPYLFTMAHRLGYTIETYTDDFFCPTPQQQGANNENLYRVKQLSQNIQGLLLAATTDLEKK